MRATDAGGLDSGIAGEGEIDKRSNVKLSALGKHKSDAGSASSRDEMMDAFEWKQRNVFLTRRTHHDPRTYGTRTQDLVKSDDGDGGEEPTF